MDVNHLAQDSAHRNCLISQWFLTLTLYEQHLGLKIKNAVTRALLQTNQI